MALPGLPAGLGDDLKTSVPCAHARLARRGTYCGAAPTAPAATPGAGGAGVT